MVLNVFCLFFLLHAQFGVFTSEGHQPFTKLHSHVSCAQFASHMERPFKEQRRSARHAALCAPFFLSSNFFLGKTGSTEVRVVYDFMIFVAHPLRLKKPEVDSSQYIYPQKHNFMPAEKNIGSFRSTSCPSIRSGEAEMGSTFTSVNPGCIPGWFSSRANHRSKQWH